MATRRSLPPKGPPPPRKRTMEVDISWLLPDEHRSQASERPRLSVRPPSPSLEPAPPIRRTSLKPPRRETMDVKLDWLEPDERGRLSQRPRRGPPPLPQAQAQPARARPPPLPQSPVQAAKPRRAHPAPIPREDPPESVASRRRSLKPPKR